MTQKKILLIDDDPRNIFALTAVLKSRTYNCVSCTNAIEALEILKSQKDFDVILLDMMMPEMDGYEAIPLIKEIPHYSKIPLIAVTAQAMSGDKEKCIKAGADEYISKPIDIDKLMHLLNLL
ncbi:response regulator [Flavobacterium sp.]|uniref:response regulator n=1 Tax=Flavobacterium sp. TaxID=239 RepID=UPI00260DF70E|nr:response regulator [Flavobacterium sp.]MDD3004092.1 response regulator [Flavobacterium sp.]